MVDVNAVSFAACRRRMESGFGLRCVSPRAAIEHGTRALALPASFYSASPPAAGSHRVPGRGADAIELPSCDQSPVVAELIASDGKRWFVDRAAEIRTKGLDATAALPRTLPETYVESLRIVDPTAPSAPHHLSP